jgi:L-lactate dehydrogenase complex protein LldE
MSLKVSLFITCLADQGWPNVGKSAVRVLRRLGCEVDFPEAQTCCGQPAFNSGRVADARSTALTLLEAFEHSEYVVSPSGSCAGMVRHYFAELFAGDPALEKRARRLASITYEFSEFLHGVLKIEGPLGKFERRASYHPSCHATRLLGVKEQPLALLGRVQGLELLPLPFAEDCCGFGGAFSVKLDELSAAMATEKAKHVSSTGVDCLIGTDLGCLMNIGGILEKQGRPVETLHLAEVLDRAGA